MLLVEALPRLGGRAHTSQLAGLPLDLGCGWLHSAERNPLAALADAAGIKLDRSKAAWGEQLRDVGAAAGTQDQAWAAYEAFGAAASARSTGERPRRRRNVGRRPMATLRRRAQRLHERGRDRPALGRRLPRLRRCGKRHQLAAPRGLRRLHRRPRRRPACRPWNPRYRDLRRATHLRLDTDRGPIEARAAIVTVSTAVLASGAIRFDPPADEHLHAASRLPLGLADKIFLSLRRAGRSAAGEPPARPLRQRPHRQLLPAALRPTRSSNASSAASSPANSRPRARPPPSPSSPTSFARLLGADFARGLAPLAVTAWGREPTILGSYSHALPGSADARAVLARPVSPRLCFAGEACSPRDFSTAHGAWETGIAAADQIAAAL